MASEQIEGKVSLFYYSLICVVAVFLTCCGNKGVVPEKSRPSFSKDSPTISSEQKGNIVSDDSVIINAGKRWLKEKIESFFNDDENFKKGFSSFCTEQYAEFKSDVTNVGMEGGLSESELKSKWGRRYSEYAGIGEGFMVAGTDFGKIEVVSCEFKNMTEMKNYLYDVLIIDQSFHSKFVRQVVLVKTRNSFLIDNVREISNEFVKQQ